jgi:hypothetical protein
VRLGPDFAGERVDGGNVGFVTLDRLADAAGHAIVLLDAQRGIARELGAGGERRHVDEPGLGAVSGRPVVVAARGARAHFLGQRPRRRRSHARIGLNVLGGIVIDGLAGLLVYASRPVNVVEMKVPGTAVMVILPF